SYETIVLHLLLASFISHFQLILIFSAVTAATEIYTLSYTTLFRSVEFGEAADRLIAEWERTIPNIKFHTIYNAAVDIKHSIDGIDRKSTRLNSSHVKISYAVFCLKKKMTIIHSRIIQIIKRTMQAI